MKRDMDLVRDILLKIEAASEPGMADLLPADVTQEQLDLTTYNLNLLIDEGFVKGVEAHTLAQKNWFSLTLTWRGHEFLDDIREPEIWKKAKAGAKQAGAASLQFLWDIAKAYAKQQAREKLGLPL